MQASLDHLTVTPLRGIRPTLVVGLLTCLVGLALVTGAGLYYTYSLYASSNLEHLRVTDVEVAQALSEQPPQAEPSLFKPVPTEAGSDCPAKSRAASLSRYARTCRSVPTGPGGLPGLGVRDGLSRPPAAPQVLGRAVVGGVRPHTPTWQPACPQGSRASRATPPPTPPVSAR